MITGGARGQGAAEARIFAREGARVVIADVLDQEGSAVAAEIAESGTDALYVHLNVSDEDNWREAIEATVSAYGKLDILVNNAAIWRSGHVADTSSDQWDQVLEINAKGVFLGTKAAIPEMRKAGGGSIVNISSTAGLVGSRTSTAYSASKGAVRLLTKSTAVYSTAPSESGPTRYTQAPSTLPWETKCGPTPPAGRRPSTAPC